MFIVEVLSIFVKKDAFVTLDKVLANVNDVIVGPRLVEKLEIALFNCVGWTVGPRTVEKLDSAVFNWGDVISGPRAVEKLEIAEYINVEKGELNEAIPFVIVVFTTVIFLIKEDKLDMASFGEYK